VTQALSEDTLSTEVVDFFSSMVATSDFRDQVVVREKQQVVMNLAIGRDAKSAEWRYFIGCQQQDIVFFLKDDVEAIPVLPKPTQYHWLSTSQRESGFIRVPLLVCELKVNRNFTSDQFITYSRIAEQIRDVHPYCGYYLIIGGAGRQQLMPETILRQAKGFNRVFLKWEDEKAVVWRDVENHLSYLRDRAGVIATRRDPRA